MSNYVVPLLHCLIGIGNDLLNNFRDVVSERIEYLSHEEVQARSALVAMDEKLCSLVLQRDSFAKSADGKRLASLVRKVKKCDESMVRLGAIGEQSNAIQTRNNNISPFALVLQSILDFVDDEEEENEEEDNEEDDVEEGAPTLDNVSTMTLPDTTDEAVREKIGEVKEVRR